MAPLTQDALAAAELALGVALPSHLVRLLHLRNGGVVADAWNACPTPPNSYAVDHVPFEEMFGLAPASVPQSVTLLDTPYLLREWDLPAGLVLLSGQGHYWIALDYRAGACGAEPAVTWIDNEMSQELRLANDFRTFVESLTSSSTYVA